MLYHRCTTSAVLLLLAGAVFSGCAGPAAHYPGNQAGRAQAGSRDAAPAYYYFTTAQLKAKQGDINEAQWLVEQALTHDPDSVSLRLELARLLLIKKDTDRALRIVREILDVHPDHKQALTMAGRIFLRTKNNDEAKQVFERLVGNGDADQAIYLQLGRFYWDKNDLDNAHRVFERMVKDYPDSYAAYYFLGKVLRAQGKDELAEKAFLKSLSLEDSIEEPRIELLRIFQSRQQHHKMTQVYRDLLKNNPQNYSIAFEFALHMRDTGQQEHAVRLLAELGRQSRKNGNIIAVLFEKYIEAKQYDTAAWIVEGMLQGDRRNPDLHYFAGLSYDGIEKGDQALRHLLKVSHPSKFFYNAAVLSALLYHDMGKIDRAIEVVQNAISKEPDKPEYYLYLGSFLEELERYPEAVDALKRGVQIDDTNSKLHFRLGVVFDKMGRKEASMEAMKTVLRLSPSHAEALNYLGYTYADLGINLDEAETLIQSALKIKPQDGYITDSLGWVYYKKGNYAEALKYLQKAADLVPDDPTIMEHLGDLFLKMGKPKDAVKYYRRSLEKEPKNPEVVEEKIENIMAPTGK